MERRLFLSNLLAGASAWPWVALAQPALRPRRIGIIDDSPLWDYFRERLRELGDVGGQPVALEYRVAEGNPNRLLAAARELAQLPVDVIAVAGSPAAKAAQAATSTVPVVAMVIGDPVAIGLVKNRQRPEGNITGNRTIAPELAAKRLDLLKNLLPYLSRVAYFWNPNNASNRIFLEQLRKAAPKFGTTMVSVEASAAAEFDGALRKLAGSRLDAMMTGGDVLQQRNLDVVVDFQMKNRLPGMFPRREDVAAGGLMSYGISVPDLYRRGAVYAHRILQGARPAELPFERPVRYELVINRTTARRLGLTIPRPVEEMADELVD
jgi:putative tryptophan/tyrosine transport system substrate-binding protein